MDNSKISSGAGNSTAMNTQKHIQGTNKNATNQRHGAKKTSSQQATKPDNITINTCNQMLIGSAFQMNSGNQTAKIAQVYTTTSSTSQKSQPFLQINKKKTPTNQTSNHLNQFVIQHRVNPSQGDHGRDQQRGKRGVSGSNSHERNAAGRGQRKAVAPAVYQQQFQGTVGSGVGGGIGNNYGKGQVPIRDKSGGYQANDNMSQNQNVQIIRQKRSNRSVSSKNNNDSSKNDSQIQNLTNFGINEEGQLKQQNAMQKQLLQMQQQISQSSRTSQTQLKQQNKRQIVQESQVQHLDMVSQVNKSEIYGSLSSQAQLAAVTQNHLIHQENDANIYKTTQSKSQQPRISTHNNAGHQQQKMFDQTRYDKDIQINKQIQAQTQMGNHHNIQTNYGPQRIQKTSMNQQMVYLGGNGSQNQEVASKSVKNKTQSSMVSNHVQEANADVGESAGLSIGVTRVANKALYGDRLLLKSREGTMRGNKPRNDSGNSTGQSLAGPHLGNVTATSACNQSFQFGYSNQNNFGQALVSANSGGRGGSSGSNPRGKQRKRSGSNKNIKSKSKDNNRSNQIIQPSTIQKNLKNPKITINTNKAQLVHGLQQVSHEIGVSTTKTAHGIRESSFIAHNVSSNKNRDNNFIQINTKNAITPGSGNAMNKGLIQGGTIMQQPYTCTSGNNNQKMKFDQKSIKQKLQSHNEKVGMGNNSSQQTNVNDSTNFANLNYIHTREPATTKNTENNLGMISNKNANGTLYQKRLPLNYHIQDQKQSALHTTTNKNEVNKSKGNKTQLTDASAFKKQSKVDNTAKQPGHSNILNKYGKTNQFNRNTLKKTSSKNHEKNITNPSANKEHDETNISQLQPVSRSNAQPKMTILNTQGSLGNQVAGDKNALLNNGQMNNAQAQQNNSSNPPQRALDIQFEKPQMITFQQSKASQVAHITYEQMKIKPIDENQQRIMYKTISGQEQNQSDNINKEVYKVTNSKNNKKNKPNQIKMDKDQEIQQYDTQTYSNANTNAINQNQYINQLNDFKKSSELIQTFQQVQTGQYVQYDQAKTRSKINVNLKNQNVLQKSFENEVSSSKVMLISNEENINASADLWDQKSQASQRSKYSKQSKHSRQSRQSRQSKQSKNSRQNKQQKMGGFQNLIANRHVQGYLQPDKNQGEMYKMKFIHKPVNQNNQQDELQILQQQQQQQQMTQQNSQNQQHFQSNDSKSVYSNKQSHNSGNMHATSSMNSSQSQKHSKQKLQTVGMIQNNLNSQPNLTTALNDVQGENTDSSTLQQVPANKQLQQQLAPQQVKQYLAEKQEQLFFQQKLQERDNFVLLLYQKVENMQSQIEELRSVQNQSSVQNIGALVQSASNVVGGASENIQGSVSMQQMPNASQSVENKVKGSSNGSQSQSNLIQTNSLQQNMQYNGGQPNGQKKKGESNIALQHNIPLLNLQSDQANIKSQKINTQNELMTLKLNETSDNEELNEQHYNQSQPFCSQNVGMIGQDMDESVSYQNNYDQTVGFVVQSMQNVQQQRLVQGDIQQDNNNDPYASHVNKKQVNLGDKNQKRIENVYQQLNKMEKKLEAQKFNNRKKIADLRKHCATSIENHTDRISSRFLDSGGNSGETGRNQNGTDINGNSGSGNNTNKTNTNGSKSFFQRTSNRHYQSTSDADINSLVTVGEDFSKFTRQSNRISDRLDKRSDKPVNAMGAIDQEENSPFMRSESMGLSMNKLVLTKPNFQKPKYLHMPQNSLKNNDQSQKLVFLESEPLSQRIGNIQLNKNNNDTFSPDFMDTAENNHNQANPQQIQQLLVCQNQGEEKIIDYKDPVPMLISAVSEVDMEEDNEEDEDDIGGRAQHIESIEVIDDCQDGMLQVFESSSSPINQDEIIQRASIMNYAIVEDDSEQFNYQATFPDNFYDHQQESKQYGLRTQKKVLSNIPLQQIEEEKDSIDFNGVRKIENIGEFFDDENLDSFQQNVENNTMHDLERQWQLQQLDSKSDESFEDKESEVIDGKDKHGKRLNTNLSEKNAQQQLIKTQKIMMNTKMINDTQQSSIDNQSQEEQKVQQSFEFHQNAEKYIENKIRLGADSEKSKAKALQFHETQQIGKISNNGLQNHNTLYKININKNNGRSTQERNNGDGLSKTLSKDNLAQKKANLLNAGQLIKKNIISQNYQLKDKSRESQQRKHKIKLVNTSENARKQHMISETRQEVTRINNNPKFPKLKLMDRSQNKRQKQVQINNYFTQANQSDQVNLTQQNSQNHQNLLQQQNDSQNENTNSMERQLQQLDELERNEHQHNLLQIQQHFRNNQSQYSIENSSIREDSRHSNEQSRSLGRVQIGRVHQRENLVQFQGLQGQGQEFTDVGNNPPLIHNNSSNLTQSEYNNIISIQQTNTSNPTQQMIVDTTFQPINMSSNSSLTIQQHLQHQQISQNQSSQAIQNAQDNQAGQSQNFAANVVQFTQFVSQTPSKRLIKKNINTNAYPGNNPAMDNSHTQSQFQHQAQQQQQALIKMQNKAQILYQNQSNNRTEHRNTQNQSSSIERAETLKKMLKLKHRRNQNDRDDSATQGTTTSQSLASQQYAQMQKQQMIGGSVQSSQNTIQSNQQRPQPDIYAASRERDETTKHNVSNQSPPLAQFQYDDQFQFARNSGTNQGPIMRFNLQNVITKQSKNQEA